MLESQLSWDTPEEFVTKIADDFETAQAVKNILDFYILIASAAHDKTINREKAFDYWEQPVISYWTKYSPLLKGRRKLLGSEAFRELEWFRNESVKAHPYFAENAETMLEADNKLLKKKESTISGWGSS